MKCGEMFDLISLSLFLELLNLLLLCDEGLQHFVEATSSMDGLKMGELMLEKLVGGVW